MRLHPPIVTTQNLQYFEGTYAIPARMESTIFKWSPSNICISFCLHRTGLEIGVDSSIPKMGADRKVHIERFLWIFFPKPLFEQYDLPLRIKHCSLFFLARKTTTDPRSNKRGRCTAASRRVPRVQGKDFRRARKAWRERPARE